MYPTLDKTDYPFYRSAGKSIHGEFKDSDIEEWYEIPELGSGNKVG